MNVVQLLEYSEYIHMTYTCTVDIQVQVLVVWRDLQASRSHDPLCSLINSVEFYYAGHLQSLSNGLFHVPFARGA